MSAHLSAKEEFYLVSNQEVLLHLLNKLFQTLLESLEGDLEIYLEGKENSFLFIARAHWHTLSFSLEEMEKRMNHILTPFGAELRLSFSKESFCCECRPVELGS